MADLVLQHQRDSKVTIHRVHVDEIDLGADLPSVGSLGVLRDEHLARAPDRSDRRCTVQETEQCIDDEEAETRALSHRLVTVHRPGNASISSHAALNSAVRSMPSALALIWLIRMTRPLVCCRCLPCSRICSTVNSRAVVTSPASSSTMRNSPASK